MPLELPCPPTTGPLFAGPLFAQGFWFPEAASTFAGEVDFLYDLILWISVGFFALIFGGMVYFVVKYRRRDDHPPLESPSHHLPLEVSWAVVPTLFIVVIFGLGFKGYLDMRNPPDDAYEIVVTAKKWGWSFQYPNGVNTTDLYMPTDQPVKLRMVSQDVLHSFFVPAFRAKQDVVPGRYSWMWFECTVPSPEEGYLYECTEYCGTGHSTMIGRVHAMPPDDFNVWLVEARQEIIRTAGERPVEYGTELYSKAGCVQCHSLDGSKRVGPSFKGLYGRDETMSTGETLVAGPEYLRESIVNPNAKIVQGYNGQMPSYQGQFQEIELEALIRFIASLGDSKNVERVDGKVDAATPAEGDAVDRAVGVGEEDEAEEAAKTAAPDA